MEHSFNVQFAQKYGIEEAIIVHNFYFWLKKNIANEKHLHDGRYWTYNSNSAFCSLFPYMNKTKVFRVLKNLDEKGIILKGNFNTNLWDKTLWYSFSDFGVSELSMCGYNVIDFAKMNHRDFQSEPTIPYNKQTDTITDNKEKEDNKLSSKKKFNFKQQLLYLGVSEDIANDFLLVRKNKKATNSETAFKRIASEIIKSGLTANECITISVEHSWQGFKAEWVNNIKPSRKNDFFNSYTPNKISNSATEYLSNLKVDIQHEANGVKYLADGTYIENGKRFYRNKFNQLIEIPIGLIARPNECYEYNRNMMVWVQDENTKSIDDMLL